MSSSSLRWFASWRARSSGVIFRIFAMLLLQDVSDCPNVHVDVAQKDKRGGHIYVVERLVIHDSMIRA